ncbi:Valine--tRNA ligase, mitochondrial 1 [Nymphon striatum]|nr:Valine--tRNA ligase, mitochondrial 1 [Nymphon striatum]
MLKSMMSRKRLLLLNLQRIYSADMCNNVSIWHKTFCSNSYIPMDSRVESVWKVKYNQRVHKTALATKDLSKFYNPDEVENEYHISEETKENFQDNKRQTFTMILPPPNITGSLHLGHALTIAVQDALIIWNQMNDVNTMWVPGCDHGGISTQVRVEQLIKKERNVNRNEISTENLIDEILNWKVMQENSIFQQLHSIGANLDFKRSYFTLDDKMSQAVIEAFIRLSDMGLIYRKLDLVNWCCYLQSTISDIEVEHIQLDGPDNINVPKYDDPVEFGFLYTFAYQIEGSTEEICVSTTRPETMLGDVAIAVHPNDDRYFKFHNRFAVNPFTQERIPIILDEIAEPKFGTGAVKITPAHNQNDFEVSLRHSLPYKIVFTENGRIGVKGTLFHDLPRFEARTKIIEELQNLGLFREKEPHKISIPVCSRSGDVVEKFPKSQWFLNCQSMATKAINYVKSGQLELIPKHREKVWFNWLEKNKDWCLSRQLKWGHRIPAYKIIHPELKGCKYLCLDICI